MGVQNLVEVLTSGCDERIAISDRDGTNKYYLNPFISTDFVQRGSCTCNNLTPLAYKAVQELYNKEQYDSYKTLLAHQTDRIQRYINPEDPSKVNVYYAPSGSDLMYLTILFQYLLHPIRRILNIVSCPEELGAGSRVAAKGSYFSYRNQFNESLPRDAKIHEDLDVDVFFVPARNKRGKIKRKNKLIRSAIKKHNHLNPVIGNLVYGSKSGIKDDLAILEQIQYEHVMWVVDVCQYRVSNYFIRDLLKKGALVMITGSKFFQAPPFCGAMLVPDVWHERLKKISGENAKIFDRLFSRYDFPQDLENIGSQFRPIRNYGLRLRWQAALAEIEALNQYSRSQVDDVVLHWREAVVQRLLQNGFFEIMPCADNSHDCIISFSCRCAGQELDTEQLKVLFESIVRKKHLIGNRKKRIFIGKPVCYNKNAFIRLAIGSQYIRESLAGKGVDRGVDWRIIEIIEETIIELFGSKE